jgi:hypothetical protein
MGASGHFAKAHKRQMPVMLQGIFFDAPAPAEPGCVVCSFAAKRMHAAYKPVNRNARGRAEGKARATLFPGRANRRRFCPQFSPMAGWPWEESDVKKATVWSSGKIVKMPGSEPCVRQNASKRRIILRFLRLLL